MLVKCPQCGVEGRLYYSKRIGGFYVKHGSNSTHYIKKDDPLEIPIKCELTLVPYFGGDFFLLKILSKVIPPHQCYVEVFGGGASLLLNKPRSRVEIYNDKDNDLVNLFRIVKEKYDDFMKEFEYFIYARTVFYDYRSKFKDEKDILDDVKRAAYFFALQRMAYGASILGAGFSAGPRKNEAARFFNALDDLKKIHNRLKNVIVENLDFRECIKKYDTETTFFYCDPPHLYVSTEKDKTYYKEKFTEDDFFDLLSILTKIKGKFLLKQTEALNIDKIIGKYGFKYRKVSIRRSVVADPRATKRGLVSYYLIANYNL